MSTQHQISFQLHQLNALLETTYADLERKFLEQEAIIQQQREEINSLKNELKRAEEEHLTTLKYACNEILLQRKLLDSPTQSAQETKLLTDATINIETEHYG